MSEPLSDNQTRLLVAIRRGGPMTTQALGDVRDRHREPIGRDTARKVLARLEKRDLLASTSDESVKTWWLTEAGLDLINEVSPAPADGEGSPSRPYLVFEEMTLDELLARLEVGADEAGRTTLYVQIATVEGKNTRHAYSVVGKQAFPGVDAEPRLVAVADRHFQPKTVRVRNNTSVSVA